MNRRHPAAARRPRPKLSVLAAALSLLAAAAPAGAAVVISQIYGGGGNSGGVYNADFVELRNTGSSAVSLAGWTLQYASAAGSTWGGGQTTALSGSIAAGGYYLIKLAPGANTGQPNLPTPDATGSTAMSATAGKLALVNNSATLSGACPLQSAPNGAIVDFVGFGGTASCSEGGTPAPGPSASTALLRADAGCSDSNNNGSDFSTGTPAARNSASPVTACGNSSGGDPQPEWAATYTIQGSGARSPLVGRLVLTRGVVTRLTNNGFFIQDLVGDGNPLTSDGLYVFSGTSRPAAAVVGNLVAVSGTVAEFNTGAASNAGTAARTVTQLTTITAVTLDGSGYTISPTAVSLPEAVEGDLERYEGMLVTLNGPFTVQQNYFQGRYGQLTLAVGGRLETPTNRHRPGTPAALALADENARRRIILDDGSSLQNPVPTPYFGAGALPRAGDLAGSITGVLDYGLATASNTGFGDDKIHPTVAPVFSVANPRSSTPPVVGGNVKVGSFNVLNYFTTFTDGNNAAGQSGQGCNLGSSVSAANCRGASNRAEFVRQRAKIIEALAAIDADVLGLMEIQNNGNVAVQDLVDGLNQRLGGSRYASIALPAQSTGTDAIRVAMIYQPARLLPLAAPLSDVDPINNRPTLAQSFVLPNGERFSVLVNHFKSKSSCPAAGDADAAGNVDAGDGQGCWNGQRVQQAQRLRSFIAQVQASSGSNDVLVIGDLNAYAQEDPVFALTGNGFVDEIGRFHPQLGYSYVFDGAAGRLDHAISSATLSARTVGAAHWPINADESPTLDYNLEFKAPLTCNGTAPCPADPYTPSVFRSSDHDPVIVGLALYKTLVAATGSPTLTGTAGDDILMAGAGRRTLTGGTGRDVFVFNAAFAGGATITDFQPGADRISLGAVLRSLGISSNNPIGQGYLTCRTSGSDAVISVDPDAGGPAAARSLLQIKNQTCSVLSSAHFAD